jgi:hypothetical protein
MFCVKNFAEEHKCKDALALINYHLIKAYGRVEEQQYNFWPR